MSYEPWPADLPQKPTKDSFSRSPAPNVNVWQPEQGPPKTSMRFTRPGKLQSYAFIVTLDQAERVFEREFFEAALGDGAMPFLWEDPITGVAYGWKFDSSGTPYVINPLSSMYMLGINVYRLP